MNKLVGKRIRPRCPRCRRKMSVVQDECSPKLGLLSAYCYSSDHFNKIKLKMVLRFQTTGNNRDESNYSMEGLTCFICGGRMWEYKTESYHAGNKMVYDCPVCKVGIEYLGKNLKTITYNEIIRVIVKKSKRY